MRIALASHNDSDMMRGLLVARPAPGAAPLPHSDEGP